MRLLVFAWRDIKNPQMGGAEIFRHALFTRLVKMGHEITLLTAGFPGAKPHERMEGYDVYRVGGRYTVYALAPLLYWEKFHGKVDAVIDEINGIPFFTPFFVREKKIFMVLHVVDRIWYLEYPFPLAWIFFHFERFMLRLYSQLPTVTISNSSREDLRALGFRDVSVLQLGVDISPLAKVQPKKKGTFVFVGRLKAAKHPEHAVEALGLLRADFPDAHLHIVGRGPEEKRLRERIHVLGLDSNVTLHGFLSNASRNQFLARAEAIIVPSEREGWGLIVIEANAVGTPAVGYDVNGLRDSIQAGKTGLLAHALDVRDLSRQMHAIMHHNARYSAAALRESKKYTWDTTAEQFDAVLHKIN